MQAASEQIRHDIIRFGQVGRAAIEAVGKYYGATPGNWQTRLGHELFSRHTWSQRLEALDIELTLASWRDDDTQTGYKGDLAIRVGQGDRRDTLEHWQWVGLRSHRIPTNLLAALGSILIQRAAAVYGPEFAVPPPKELVRKRRLVLE